MEKIQQPDSPSSKSNNSSSFNCTTNTKTNIPPNIKSSYGRYCHIVKRPDFDGYGFNLHSEKIKPGQYIGKVDRDSPAEAAGLREGDQIIEVNGVNIGVETHKQVVQRIKAISNEVRLLLIDPNTESAAATNATKTTANIGASENSSNHNNSHNNSTTTMTTTPNSTTAAATTPTIVPMIVEATVASEHQKDEVTSISMVSRKSQSTYSNNPTVNVTDSDTSEKAASNGHHATTTIVNGKSPETPKTPPSEVAPTITTTPPPPPPSEQQQMKDSSSNKSLTSQDTDNQTQSQNKPGLNLNLTAAEMRAKLLAKKKFDPKNESVDLKMKFDIIQKL